MQVEIWSDIACPWCAVGKRRFSRALEGFEHADRVQVRWRSFELDPSAPALRHGGYADHLAAKYGTTAAQGQAMIDQMTATAAGDGLQFRFDIIRPGNTFAAHRLLHLAGDRGLQDALKERLLTGYLENGAAIGDAAALEGLALEAGLDAGEVRDVLGGDAYADAVRADERQAAAFGISAVPFFVFDRRYGVAGAESAQVLLQTLQRTWQDAQPLVAVVGGGETAADGCADGSCAV